MPFTATWMDIEMITVREISWAEKDKYHVICGILKKKKDSNDLIYRTETDSQTHKTNL